MSCTYHFVLSIFVTKFLKEGEKKERIVRGPYCAVTYTDFVKLCHSPLHQCSEWKIGFTFSVIASQLVVPAGKALVASVLSIGPCSVSKCYVKA